MNEKMARPRHTLVACQNYEDPKMNCRYFRDKQTKKTNLQEKGLSDWQQTQSKYLSDMWVKMFLTSQLKKFIFHAFLLQVGAPVKKKRLKNKETRFESNRSSAEGRSNMKTIISPEAQPS